MITLRVKQFSREERLDTPVVPTGADFNVGLLRHAQLREARDHLRVRLLGAGSGRHQVGRHAAVQQRRLLTVGAIHGEREFVIPGDGSCELVRARVEVGVDVEQ